MRRTAVLNLSNFDKIFEVFRKNGILLFLVASFVLGLFAGVFSAEKIKVFENVVTDYLMVGEISKTGFLSCLFDHYFNILLIICICFICGTSMFGVLLSPICVILFSFFYGIFSANIYSGYGLKGIAFYAVMILPGTILLTISLLLAALESFKFSFLIPTYLAPLYSSETSTNDEPIAIEFLFVKIEKSYFIMIKIF